MDRGLLEAMQRRAVATAGEFVPQAVSNVLWALATMGERADRGLLEAMQGRAAATAGAFDPQGVANVLWGLATMGERANRGLLEAMESRATATAGEFSPQNVAKVLWALAVMDASAEWTHVPLAARVLDFRDQLTVEDKRQLHQWLLSSDLDIEGVARVKEEIGEECLQAFAGRVTHESQLQRELVRDVVAALRSERLQVETEEEFRDAGSGYSIDVLVRAAGSLEWAVQVDGPSHFLGDGRTPRGSTLLKRKQLGQLGYAVVSVPFWAWNALGDEEAKLRYIQEKLRGG